MKAEQLVRCKHIEYVSTVSVAHKAHCVSSKSIRVSLKLILICVRNLQELGSLPEWLLELFPMVLSKHTRTRRDFEIV